MATAAVQAAFDILGECGWIPAGTTSTETVRIPTTRSPVFGGMGGELRTFGGRSRFQKMNWFVTVGPRTVNFYKRAADGPAGMIQAKTSDVVRIRELANEKGLD